MTFRNFFSVELCGSSLADGFKLINRQINVLISMPGPYLSQRGSEMTIETLQMYF